MIRGSLNCTERDAIREKQIFFCFYFDHLNSELKKNYTSSDVRFQDLLCIHLVGLLLRYFAPILALMHCVRQESNVPETFRYRSLLIG